MEAFIDRVNSDSPTAQASQDDAAQTLAAVNDTPVPEREERKTKKVRIPECDKRGIRLGLRYAVLKRDRFRCVICGRSPATCLGVALHVDHIVAWVNGGKTVIENLRSTCEDCNRGKGPKREDGEPGAE
jgi:5-methylcytosine-specific restriction endonuclease McrA